MQLDNFSCICMICQNIEILNLTHSLIRYYFTNCQSSKEIVQSQQFISLTLIELIGKLNAACHITIITSLMRTLIQSICMYGTPLRFSDHWKILPSQGEKLPNDISDVLVLWECRWFRYPTGTWVQPRLLSTLKVHGLFISWDWMSQIKSNFASLANCL